jgi:hypothetical protein
MSHSSIIGFRVAFVAEVKFCAAKAQMAPIASGFFLITGQILLHQFS